MKILYDYQIFTVQKYGGISRYFYELIKYFNKNKNIDAITSLFFSNNYYISNKKDIKHINFLPDKQFRGKQRLTLFINKIISINKLQKQDFDLFHPTYYDPYFLNHINKKPFVLTVYDMIHEKFDDMFNKNDKVTQNKRILCEKASKIIAISESTKKDIIDFFDIEESKIEVVYLGNSMLSNEKKQIEVKIPEKFILFVGSREIYKNFNRFINAISRLLNDTLFVVCIGGGKFNNEELILFEKLNIQNKVLQFNLGDDDLAQCYSKALMFVFPSLYEGFGIPILEAFACKCPLVCSNTSSLPEIAGDGAEYFNPYDKESIYAAVKNILDNKDIRERLINKGTERLKYFSWEKTSEETKKVYESVVK